MTNITFSNSELLKEDEKSVIQNKAENFINRLGNFVPNITTFDISLTDANTKKEAKVVEISIRMTSSYGINQAHAEGWDNRVKTFMDALDKLEEQIRKKRKDNKK